MAENSNIEWTHHTFNPWRGCTKVSAGCAHCYAETLSGRNPKTLGMWGPKGTRVVAAEAQWKLPLRWEGQQRLVPPVHPGRPRVFCASLADVFEDWQGPMVGSKGDVVSHDSGDPPWRELGAGRRITMQDVRNRLFRLIDATPNLDWLLLTKRPENIAKMMPLRFVGIEDEQAVGTVSTATPPPNLWLGTSVENQQAADERIPHLLRVPAAVRFLSCEPLLGPVDLSKLLLGKCGSAIGHCGDNSCRTQIDWVIVGGESGPGSRPCNVEWIRSIVEQCKAAGVACFVKQLGAFVDGMASGLRLIKLNDKKGGDPAEWPADLRVREFPHATV